MPKIRSLHVDTGGIPTWKIWEVLRQLHRDGLGRGALSGSQRVMPYATKRGIVVLAGSPNADTKAGTLDPVLEEAGLKESYTERGDGAE